jgi:hypothetical protein
MSVYVLIIKVSDYGIGSGGVIPLVFSTRELAETFKEQNDGLLSEDISEVEIDATGTIFAWEVGLMRDGGTIEITGRMAQQQGSEPKWEIIDFAPMWPGVIGISVECNAPDQKTAIEIAQKLRQQVIEQGGWPEEMG